jgi:polysaccharide export outer membrane protein
MLYNNTFLSDYPKLMAKYLLLTIFLLSSCITIDRGGDTPTTASTPVITPMANAKPVYDAKLAYMLDSGDKIAVRVYEEEDLSGEFEVDGSGYISIPLIGSVKAKGVSARKLEDTITNKLANGYLIKPRVGVEVLSYRPFYILGEVNNEGSYPYVNGMNILNAVALAGGFSRRANKDDILLKRGNDEEIEVSPTYTVLPGDVITVEERFF